MLLDFVWISLEKKFQEAVGEKLLAHSELVSLHLPPS